MPTVVAPSFSASPPDLNVGAPTCGSCCKTEPQVPTPPKLEGPNFDAKLPHVDLQVPNLDVQTPNFSRDVVMPTVVAPSFSTSPPDLIVNAPKVKALRHVATAA